MRSIIKTLRTKSLFRKRYLIDEKKGGCITINKRSLLNFSSNDYLGIADHPAIKKAATKAVNDYSSSSSSSSLVAGYTKSHQQLEQAFAEHLQRECALLFNSGYHANLGVISALADRHSTIIADKYIHASLIDGILLSRAQHYRYQHHNLAQANELACLTTGKKIFITESVFSIHGDIANLSALTILSRQHKARLIVDDAHGFGILDTPHLKIDCLVTPLGKAAGSFGAIVSGSNELIEIIMQRARTYRYSTALPPAVCNASIAALKIIQIETWRRAKLLQLINFFIQQATQYALPLLSTDRTPIKSIIIGSNQTALALKNWLLEKGFFVACIRPPTVPAGQTCLRISINYHHQEQQLARLLEHIKFYLEHYAQSH